MCKLVLWRFQNYIEGFWFSQTRLPFRCILTHKEWAKRILPARGAICVKGELNHKTDLAQQTQNSAWIRKSMLILHKFSLLVVNLFTNQKNKHLKYSIRWIPGDRCSFAQIAPKPAYAFLPFLLPEKISREAANLIMLGLHWPRRPWFSNLIELNLEPLLQLLVRWDILYHGLFLYPYLNNLQLITWLLRWEVLAVLELSSTGSGIILCTRWASILKACSSMWTRFSSWC